MLHKINNVFSPIYWAKINRRGGQGGYSHSSNPSSGSGGGGGSAPRPISGIYEDCIEYLFIQRSGKNNDKEIQNLVKTLIDLHFRNPNYENIKKMVKALDSKYGTILRDKIADKNIEGINSIVTNKNNVAHGKVSNATIRDIKNYHKNALKIFKVLEEIFSKEV